MPSSGVEISQKVIDAYDKLKNPPKNLHWVKCHLNDEMTQIDLLGKLAKKPEGDDFDITKIEEEFQGQDCFYMVIDVTMPRDKDGRVQSKVVFIQWVPDDSKIKKKMMYASSAENLKAKLDGVGVKIEAHDISDVTYDAILEAIGSNTGKK